MFHVNKKFGDAIPDSALLIGVGLLVGFILDVFKVNHQVSSSTHSLAISMPFLGLLFTVRDLLFVLAAADHLRCGFVASF